MLYDWRFLAGPFPYFDQISGHFNNIYSKLDKSPGIKKITSNSTTFSRCSGISGFCKNPLSKLDKISGISKQFSNSRAFAGSPDISDLSKSPVNIDQADTVTVSV